MATLTIRGLDPVTQARHGRSTEAGVLAWLDSLEISEVATTTVTAAELRYGVARLPEGHRKRELTVMIRGILAEDFYGRILPFDEPASAWYASLVTSRERIGRPIGIADLDWDHQVIHVTGKGGRGRACPFGPKTADALRR